VNIRFHTRQIINNPYTQVGIRPETRIAESLSCSSSDNYFFRLCDNLIPLFASRDYVYKHCDVCTTLARQIRIPFSGFHIAHHRMPAFSKVDCDDRTGRSKQFTKLSGLARPRQITQENAATEASMDKKIGVLLTRTYDTRFPRSGSAQGVISHPSRSLFRERFGSIVQRKLEANPRLNAKTLFRRLPATHAGPIPRIRRGRTFEEKESRTWRSLSGSNQNGLFLRDIIRVRWLPVTSPSCNQLEYKIAGIPL